MVEADLEEIRRVFSALFDRAARATVRAGLDLDDVIVERHVDCRIGGQHVRIAADHLSNPERFVDYMLGVANANCGAGAADVLITALSIAVVRDPASGARPGVRPAH